MTIVISSSRLHFPLVGIVLRVRQLDITQMQAHRMFHAIELNTNGMLARSLTTGAPHNPSGFRRRPLDPVFAQLAQAYRKKGDASRANELFGKVSQAKAEASEQQARRGGLLRIVRDGAH